MKDFLSHGSHVGFLADAHRCGSARLSRPMGYQLGSIFNRSAYWKHYVFTKTKARNLKPNARSPGPFTFKILKVYWEMSNVNTQIWIFEYSDWTIPLYNRDKRYGPIRIERKICYYHSRNYSLLSNMAKQIEFLKSDGPAEVQSPMSEDPSPNTAVHKLISEKKYKTKNM